MLTGPGVENDDEESCENGQLQDEKDDMLLLVVYDAELLMIRQAKEREEAVEDARCVYMLLFFSQLFVDFIFLQYRLTFLRLCCLFSNFSVILFRDCF